MKNFNPCILIISGKEPIPSIPDQPGSSGDLYLLCEEIVSYFVLKDNTSEHDRRCFSFACHILRTQGPGCRSARSADKAIRDFHRRHNIEALAYRRLDRGNKKV